MLLETIRERDTMAKNNGANLGFESELWRVADSLRSNMDAAEYRHVARPNFPEV